MANPVVAAFTAAMSSYAAGDWVQALTALAVVSQREPDFATRAGAPLLIAHCRIELAKPDQLAALAALPPETPAASEDTTRAVVEVACGRAQALCRAGDPARAATLLRWASHHDPALARTYAGLLTPAPVRAPVPAPPSTPSFPADPTLGAAAVRAIKARLAGLRVLIVFRQLFKGDPTRTHDPFDNLRRAAERFGLVARAIDSHHLPDGVDEAGYASWLQGEILAFKPQLIVYDDLFETGLSAKPRIGDEVALVLENARTLLGLRVVKCLLDAWRVVANGAERPLRGLGASIDLLNHFHPALIADQDAAARAHSFCYLPPYELPSPTVAPGTIARACFVGAVMDYNRPRLAWWAEIGQRALPVDFVETVHGTAQQRSDQDYANLFCRYQLSVSLTERPNGVRIITGRPVEVSLSGGVLLEEDSPNCAYFFARGSHYEGFSSLDGLAGLIDDLLRSDTRRHALAREAHAWAHEYFTGDRYWGGLLARLF